MLTVSSAGESYGAVHLQFPLWRHERYCIRRRPGHTHEQITLQSLSHNSRTYIDYFKSIQNMNRIVRDQAGATWRQHGPQRSHWRSTPDAGLVTYTSDSPCRHCSEISDIYFYFWKQCAAEAACSEIMPACNAPARPS